MRGFLIARYRCGATNPTEERQASVIRNPPLRHSKEFAWCNHFFLLWLILQTNRCIFIRKSCTGDRLWFVIPCAVTKRAENVRRTMMVGSNEAWEPYHLTLLGEQTPIHAQAICPNTCGDQVGMAEETVPCKRPNILIEAGGG